MEPYGTPGDADKVPPWASTIERHIAKPMPIPLALVVKKASKMRSIFSGSIPAPQSCTERATPFESKGLERTRSVRARSSILRMDFSGVGHDIQDDLLKLPPVRGNKRQLAGQLELDVDFCRLQLVVRHGDRFQD